MNPMTDPVADDPTAGPMINQLIAVVPAPASAARAADQLTRAATRLTQAVAWLPVAWQSSWRTVLTDTESLSGLSPACPTHPAGMSTHDVCDACDHVETWSEGLAAFMQMMQPATALPLAAWLRRCAVIIAGYRDGQEVHAADALAVARAILDEPEPAEVTPTAVAAMVAGERS